MARKRQKNSTGNENEIQKVAIYSRKSKFTGKGDSIGNQVEECRDYLRRYFSNYDTMEIDDSFEDEGRSGKNTKRPQFQRMMDCVKQGKFDAVICYRLDRISRNTRDFIEIKDDLDKYNVKFISAKDNFNASGPMGEAMMKMASIFAELERNIIAERIKDNMYDQAKTGRWLGGEPPTGYKKGGLIETITEDGKTRTSCYLKLVNEEMEMVKLIFSKFLELDSLSKTETYFRQNYINTKNDKRHTRHSIRKILSNPVYAIADKDMWEYFNSFDMEIFSSEDQFNGKYGISAYKKTEHEKDEHFVNDVEDWIVAVGKHKGVIDGKDWVKTQKMLYQNKSKSFRKQRSHSALLSGLLRCDECGDFMRPKQTTRLNADGEMVYYYMCETKEKTKKHNCHISNINGNDLDHAVCDEIKKLARDDSTFFKQLKQAQKTMSGATGTDKKIRDLLQRIKMNEKKIQNGIESLLDEGSSIYQEVNGQIEKLKADNFELRKQIDVLRGMTLDYDTMSEQEFEILRDMLQSFTKMYDTMTIEQKRQSIRIFVKRVVWDGENVHIYFWGSDDGENLILPNDDTNNSEDTNLFPLGYKSKRILPL